MLAYEHGLGSEKLSPFVDSSVDDQSRLYQSLLEFINIPECYAYLIDVPLHNSQTL